MRRHVNVLVAVVASAALALLTASSGSAEEPDAKHLAEGLKLYARTLSQMTSLPLLADHFPMTDLSPLENDGLRLKVLETDLSEEAQPILEDIFGRLPTEFASLNDLRFRLEALDAISDIDYDGVNVSVGCRYLEKDCSNPVVVTNDSGVAKTGHIIVTVPLVLQRRVTTPIHIVNSVANVHGGETVLDIGLALSLTIDLDTAAWETESPADISERESVALVGAQRGTVSVSVAAPDVSANGAFGFTDIVLSLSGFSGGYIFPITVVDPDEDGRITASELSNTDIHDLVAATRSGTLNGKLTLDSPALPDGMEYSETLRNDSLKGFIPPLSCGDADECRQKMGALGPFLTVDAEMVVSGLGQVAAGLVRAQNLSDVGLPFMDGKLADVASVAQRIVDFVDRQGVTCGTSLAVPPAGSLTGLAAGTSVYCMAVVDQTPDEGSIVWLPEDTRLVRADQNTSPDSANGTVVSKSSPSALDKQLAHFTMLSAGNFDARVLYEVEGHPKAAYRPPETLQQLASKLVGLGGFDPLEPIYCGDNPTDKVACPVSNMVRFRLQTSFDPGEWKVPYRFGDQLEFGSGLVGLTIGEPMADNRDSPIPSVRVSAKGVTLRLTIGVLMTNNLSDIEFGGVCPDPTLPTCKPDGFDRMFLQADPAKPELEVEDAIFTAVPPRLEGRLGFLKVNAFGSGITFGRRDIEAPMFAADIADLPGVTVAGQRIDNAVGLRDFLYHLTTYVKPGRLNLMAKGALSVDAVAGSKVLGQGTVTFDWKDVAKDGPIVNVTGGFTESLRVFDLSPNAMGRHRGGDSQDLIDPGASFTADAVGKRLENITDGSYCEVTGATPTVLTCELVGGTRPEPLKNTWHDGDRYRLRISDPLIALWDILDNLDTVVKSIDGLTGTEGATTKYNQKLPVLGLSPKDLVSVLADIRRTIADLRGTPGPQIVCGASTDEKGWPKDDWRAVPGSGDVVVPGSTPGKGIVGAASAKVFCRVDGPRPASAVKWTVLTGGKPVLDANGQDASFADSPGTVGSVAALTGAQLVNFVAENTAPGFASWSPGFPNGFRLRAEYTDDVGQHMVEYPAITIPRTLQDLEEEMERMLGEGADVQLALHRRPEKAPLLGMVLHYGRCSSKGGERLCRGMPESGPVLQTTLATDLGEHSLFSLRGSAAITVAYAVSSTLDVRIPLSLTEIVKEDPLLIMPSTGISVTGRFESDLNMKAGLDWLSVVLGPQAKEDGTGTGMLRGGLTFELDGDPNQGGLPIDKFLGSLDGKFTHGGAYDCETATKTTENGNPVESRVVGSLACGNASLAEVDLLDDKPNYLGQVCFWLALPGTTNDPYGSGFCELPDTSQITKRLAGKFDNWEAILTALPPVLRRIETGLRGGAQNTPAGDDVPLVRNRPADAVRSLRVDVVEPAVDGYMMLKDEAGSSQKLGQLVRKAFTEGLTYKDKLSGPDQPAPVKAVSDMFAEFPSSTKREFIDNYAPDKKLAVRVLCTKLPDDQSAGPYSDCTHATRVITDVQDLRVTFRLKIPDTQQTTPFDLGLDGIPFRLAGNLATTVDGAIWVDVGLDRKLGPYIGTERPEVEDPFEAHEISVTTTVSLGSDTAEKQVCNSDVEDPADGAILSAIPDATFHAAKDRCLSGQIGFLAVNVRDVASQDPGTDDVDKRTHAEARAWIDLSSADDGRLSVRDLEAGSVTVSAGLDAEAMVKLRFRTGVQRELGGDAFPSVVGTFDFAWSFCVQSKDKCAPRLTAKDPTFDNLSLDVGGFARGVLKPAVAQVRKLTQPFQPIIDNVSAPIPVVSDIAQFLGQKKVTLLDIMLKTQGNDLTFIQNLASLAKMAKEIDTLAEQVGDGYIPLGRGTGVGSLKLPSAKVKLALDSSGVKRVLDSLSDLEINADRGSLLRAEKGSAALNAMLNIGKNQKDNGAKTPLPGTFGVPGLTFPFMKDSRQLFSFLLGTDLVLVRYDTGPLRATAGVQYRWGPFMIGPIPLFVGIGGSVSIEGRFALGYDTSGLRRAVRNGSGSYLFDGLFIDDLDAAGKDVPELAFRGSINASAAASILIVSAGIIGRLNLTVGLDLSDYPDRDGKLRIDEVVSKLRNPVCLFDVMGRLSADLAGFLEFDFWLIKPKFEFKFLEVTLLDFEAHSDCDPNKRELAYQALKNDPLFTENKDGTLLILKMTGDNDKVTVRPVGAGDKPGTQRYTVSSGGATQTFDHIDEIRADGEGGNDTIQLLDGSSEGEADGQPITFTAKATIIGGDGNDVIQTGDGDDTIVGGLGADRIEGGGGSDNVQGGDGTDSIDGGLGNDYLIGGPVTQVWNMVTKKWDDREVLQDIDQLTGGPGSDVLVGGVGDDLLSGGPGVDPDFIDGQGRSPVPAIADSTDFLFGGGGNDVLDGGPDADRLFGDQPPAELAKQLTALPRKFSDGDFARWCDAAVSDGRIQDDLTPDGADTLVGGVGDDWLFGGGGDDRPVDPPPADTEVDPKDVQRGGALVGGGGDDRLCGNAGNDRLNGDEPATDSFSPPVGSDYLVGGPRSVPDGTVVLDDDYLEGMGADDVLLGGLGNDTLEGGVGDDDLSGGVGSDTMLGQGGRDLMVGDFGLIAKSDEFHIAPRLGSNEWPAVAVPPLPLGEQDTMRGGADSDALYGEGGGDRVYGDDGADLAFGGFGADTMRGGVDSDTLNGEIDGDTIYGDGGGDQLFGNDGLDVIFGGIGDDHVEGGPDHDVLRGDGGQDDLVGGSGGDGAEADDGDDIYGGTDADVIAGDNARVERPGGSPADADDRASAARTVTLLNVNSANAQRMGDDKLWGQAANDRIFGQGGNDQLWGSDGQDRMEGNANDASGGGKGDIVQGEAGRDLLAGGTTHLARLLDDSLNDVAFRDALDGADTVLGGDDDDVMIGDNSFLDWLGSPYLPLKLPLQSLGMEVAAVGRYGDDTLAGGGGHDTVYGQMGGDTLHGNAGGDYLVGDLGVVAQTVRWPCKWPSGSPNWTARLLHEDHGGSDRIHGDEGADYLYAGAGEDRAMGGVGDDHVEGNGGPDWLYGLSDTFDASPGAAELAGLAVERDEDDLIGGSSEVHSQAKTTGARDEGEHAIEGNADADTIIGDNGEIIRRVEPELGGGQCSEIKAPRWVRDPRSGQVARSVVLRDVNRDNSVTVTAGKDNISGGAGVDRIWGQAGDDTIAGDADGDQLEGNDGSDTIGGGDGPDRLAGGSTDNALLIGPAPTITATPPAAVAATIPRDNTFRYYFPIAFRQYVDREDTLEYVDVADTGDVLMGDGGIDVIVGDNGKLDAEGRVDMVFTAPGTYGRDKISGGDEQDQLYGQLEGDQIDGNGGEDYVVGDLGILSPARSAPAAWPGGAPNLDLVLVSPDNCLNCIDDHVKGDDTIDGGSGDDYLYGGADSDTVSGGTDDDHLEGNGGRDWLYGLGAAYEGGLPVDQHFDQDDIIGGSSHVHPELAIGAPDAGEWLMQGNAGPDVLIGDNGEITKTISADSWLVSPSAAISRTIVLLDFQRNEAPPTGRKLSEVSGGDVMEGNGSTDRLFGQAGDDCIKGDDGTASHKDHSDDYLEGNLGQDLIEGNEGEDDLIGGGPWFKDSRPPQMPATEQQLSGYPDGADFLFGGGGADVLMGDNAIVSRVRIPQDRQAPEWLNVYRTARLSMTAHRSVLPLDLPVLPPDAYFGGDQLSGEDGEDVLFGQDGRDIISGGNHDDYAEGNGAQDWLFGDRPIVEVMPENPWQLTAPIAAPPSDLEGCRSSGPNSSEPGQDDLIGGSSIVGHRDASDPVHLPSQADWSGDLIYGDGESDVVLGGNGQIKRLVMNDRYKTDTARFNPGSPLQPMVVRNTQRYEAPSSDENSPGVTDDDYIEGNGGDDELWGMNGNDTLYGNADDDQIYGGNGDDDTFGGYGDDAILGDRGAIHSHRLSATPDPSRGDPSSYSVESPALKLEYVVLRPGELYHRVDLLHDKDGTDLTSAGRPGGADRIRGGPGRDSLHGGDGDDMINGDSGGDFLFGGDGADRMWGGRGNPDPQHAADRDAGTEVDKYVDFLFGGFSAERPDSRNISDMDVLDVYTNLPAYDSWQPMMSGYNDGQHRKEEPTELSQHQEGVDFIYGGQGRDIMQTDVNDTPIRRGDRMADWYLPNDQFLHCEYPRSPTGIHDNLQPRYFNGIHALLNQMAILTGGSGGPDQPGLSLSGERELALVTDRDTDSNSSDAGFPNLGRCVNGRRPQK